MSDNRVMLDLDSSKFREMLVARVYRSSLPMGHEEGKRPFSDKHRLRLADEKVDTFLSALRGLAADGLLVRG